MKKITAIWLGICMLTSIVFVIQNTDNKTKGSIIGPIDIPIVSRETIKIDSDFDLTSLASINGWLGNGTKDFPYSLQNFDIDGSACGYCIYIGNTTKFFILINSYLHGANGIDCWPENHAFGLLLYNVKNGVIGNDTLTENDNGLGLIESHQINIVHSTFSNNQCGLYICSSMNNTFSGNHVSGNMDKGMFFKASHQNRIVNCSITQNFYGIFTQISDQEIYDTDIKWNTYGLYEFQSGSVIRGNVFDGNGNSIFASGNAVNFTNEVFSSGQKNETVTSLCGTVEEIKQITLPSRALISSADLTLEGIDLGIEALTKDQYFQFFPAIYNDLIVWQDNRDGNWEIYAYNLSLDSDGDGIPNYMETLQIEDDPASTRITCEPSVQYNPDVWGDTVVWTDIRNGNSDIYAYTFSNLTEWAVTMQPANQMHPRIEGDHVVWSDDRNGNNDIYMLNISTGETSRLSTIDWYDFAPDICNNKVVWYSYTGNPGGLEYSDIYLFDTETWEIRQITKDSAIQYSPTIFNKFIVWHDNRNGNWEIYMYNITTGYEERITREKEHSFCPNIYGNRIVYYYHDRLNEIWSVRMYDNEKKVQTDIESMTYGDSHPVIYGDTIVWINKGDMMNDLYVLNLSIRGYPRNLFLDIGCDGNIEFTFNSTFNQSERLNSTMLINQFKEYLSDIRSDSVDIPLRIKFDGPGRVKLNSLSITYSLSTVVTDSVICNSINYGVGCHNSNPHLINTTFLNNPIDIQASGESNPILLNSTFSKSKVIFYDCISNLTIQNYLHVKVEDTSGWPLNANIQITDNNREIFNASIGDDGAYDWVVIIYATLNSTGLYKNNTIITTNYNNNIFDDNPRLISMDLSHREIFSTDTNAPMVSYENPYSCQMVNSLYPTISICVTDDTGINLSAVRFYVQGFSVFYNYEVIPDGYNISYYHGHGFDDGEIVQCEIYAVDHCGNEVRYAWNFKIDLSAQSFAIPLREGWNLVSIPFETMNSSIESVLSSIDGYYDLVHTYNSYDIVHWTTYSIYSPGQLNGLTTLNRSIGFWIHVTAGCTLIVSGVLCNNTSIALRAGWNLVGYPTLNDTMTVADAMWGTGTDRVEVFDALAPYQLKEVGPTHIMKPGEGYWIRVPVDTVWSVDW
jgi:beta propeller repeat protein/parallel beta-helix repeat protein